MIKGALWAKWILSLGLILVTTWLVAMHGWALWRHAPDGHASLWRFLVVSFAMWFAPGLCWFRWGVKTCPSLLEYWLGVLTGSVVTSGVLVWSLYFAGVYGVPVAWCLVVILAGSGLAALPWSKVLKAPARLFRSLEALSWIELSGLIMVVLFGVSMWVQATGAPLTSWDAIISWDKWACDMAERQGFGRYLLGGYPQLLPSLCSVSYKLAGTWGTGFPDEQLLMHGYAAPFAMLLLFAIIRLCRLCDVSWIPCVFLCASIGSLQAWWLAGYVDVPATALIVSATALLTSLMRGILIMRNRFVVVVWIAVVLFGVGFIKGYGLLWVVFIPILAAALVRRSGAKRAVRWPLLAGGMGLALLLLSSFYIHQRVLASRMELAESDPRLHTFALQIDKSSLYDRSAKAALVRVKEALDEMGSPVDGRAGWVPPNIKRVMIGAGIVAGCLPGGVPLLGAAAVIHWCVWEETAAYDWRNALPALILFCFVCVLGWGRMGHRFGTLACTVAVLVIAWPWMVRQGQAIAGYIKNAGSSESVAVWSKRPDLRLRAVAPHQFVVRVIAEQSPLGQRARSVYVPDELSRQLGSRGVYTLKGNVFAGVHPGDLLICNKHDPEPPAFTRIASMRLPGYDRLLCCKPELSPASWSVVRSEGVIVVPGPVGMTVKGKGWLSLTVAPLVAAGSGDSIILALQFDSPEAASACSLELPESWDMITNIRSRICPITDGVWIRTVVWLDRGEGFVPDRPVERTILLKVNRGVPITIVGILAETIRQK